MQPTYEVIGQAVLKDYPLRLWAEQQEHTEELLREFALLLIGEHDRGHAPAQLVELAQMFQDRFGPLIDRLTATRQAAFQAGLDRMDSHVPLIAGMDALLDQVSVVLAAVDDYCRSGDLLALARTPEQVALYDWTTTELAAQAAGADPTPWPGPF